MGETVTSILGNSTENGLQMGDKCPSIPPGAAEKLRTPAYGGEENAMIYTVSYPSPLGELLLAEREGHLAGLWMEGQKYFLGALKGEPQERTETPVLRQAKQWLDRYFAGERPEIRELPLAPAGSAFRRAVWEILCDIPYGGTRTYGDIARERPAGEPEGAPPRLWAARWAATRSPSSFPVTGWWGAAGASPATRGDWRKSAGCWPTRAWIWSGFSSQNRGRRCSGGPNRRRW